MLTDEEFRLFRNLIYDEAGIYLKEARKDFLEHRVAKRMGVKGLSSPYWYYKLITDTEKTELLLLLDLLTVNETSFFRNGPQMELFRKVILPDVMRMRSRDMQKRLRIWSAGCSTGEEPYSVAMLAHEAIRNAPSPFLPPDKGRAGGMSGGAEGSDWDVRIFASDLSLSVLETASKGEYAWDKVRATVDEHYLSRYFDTDGTCYRVRDEIRKMVVFDFHNLKNDNGLSNLDIIFCRNVMIYFDEEEQRRLIDKFCRSLNPGGYLLLGHAESLHGLGTGFEFVYDNKGTAYKKPEQGKKSGA
ncbi:MAG: protein-glutamate O-methyltransferase CheR [Nitrospirota bacterium]|nr:protein-glutamate O-methyltransferase CheR [Nitrospirota bacterium]